MILGRKSNLKFSVWADVASIASLFILFIYGIFAIIWDNSDEISSGSTTLGLTALVSSLFLSCLLSLVERSERESQFSFPLRGIIFGILGITFLLSIVTWFPALCLLTTSAIETIAWYRCEEILQQKRQRRQKKKKSQKQNGVREQLSYSTFDNALTDTFLKNGKNMKDNNNTKKTEKLEEANENEIPLSWDSRLRNEGRLSEFVCLLIYGFTNLVLAIYAGVTWIPKAKDLNLSVYAPYAKIFGQLLDFNCALILLPVCRSLLLMMNNKREASQRNESLGHYLPLGKNLAFHKLVASVILYCSIAHVFFHFLNYADRPSATLSLFTVAPWITGPIICFAMFLIYTAAVNVVRRASYKIFWYCHHAFIIFFVFLLFHGWRRFWMWLLIPGTLYAVERFMRLKRGKKSILLLSVKWSSPILELRFRPEGNWFKFKAGQYLFLNCPSLDAHELTAEWHPFTISSCPKDLEQSGYVSVHIRVQSGGWTEALKDYLCCMNPSNSYFFELKRRDMTDPSGNTMILGKRNGPDGLPLLRVDGPHASPSQHFDEYDTTMLIGAGIGITPCASILRDVLLHRWKSGRERPKRLLFYWCLRHSEIDSFQWFVKVLCKILNFVEGLRYAEMVDGNYEAEIHVFLTSFVPIARKSNDAKKERKALQDVSNNQQQWHEKRISTETKLFEKRAGSRLITTEQLWKQFQFPTVPVTKFKETMQKFYKQKKKSEKKKVESQI
eukprot:g828.t1